MKRYLMICYLLTYSLSLLGADYFEISSKEKFHTFFSHLISPENEKALLCEGNKICLPIEKDYEESYKNYLSNRGFVFEKKSYKDVHPLKTDIMSLMWNRLPDPSFGVSAPVVQLAFWENKANAFVKQNLRHSPLFMKLEHFEIPLKKLDESIASYADKGILKAMKFIGRDGEEYVRWPIHPEDSKYFKRVEGILKGNGVHYKRGTYFYGMLSASRSLFIIDPITKKMWSLKMSTNHTGGVWVKKKMTLQQVDEGRYISDYLYNITASKKVSFRYMQPLYETITYYYPHVATGFVIREYPFEANPGKFYIPAFSVQDNHWGEFIAHLNGALDISKYWREHLNIVLARATAELAGYAGLTYNSSHTQQYLLELDHSYKPTGKILFRDLGDNYLFRPFMYSLPPSSIKEIRFLKEYVFNHLYVKYGMFKSISYSKWMFSEEEWKQIEDGGFPDFLKSLASFERRYSDMISREQKTWRNEFFSEFEMMYGAISGIKPSLLLSHHVEEGSDMTYKSRTYRVYGKGHFTSKDPFYYWNYSFRQAPCFQGGERSLDGRSCDFVLEEVNKRIDDVLGH